MQEKQQDEILSLVVLKPETEGAVSLSRFLVRRSIKQSNLRRKTAPHKSPMTFLSPSDIANEKHFDRSRNHRSRKASPRVERSVSRDPSVTPKQEPKVDNVDKEAFFDLIKSLDRKVRTSSTKEVQDSDADMVSRIKTHAQAWISSGNFLDCFQDLEVREVPGVMKRVRECRSIKEKESHVDSICLKIQPRPTSTIIKASLAAASKGITGIEFGGRIRTKTSIIMP